MHIRTLHSLVALMVLFYACASESTVEQAEDERVIEVDARVYEHLEMRLDAYFSSVSEGRFEDYVDLVYPGVFAGKDSAKAEVIRMMTNYAEQGFQNVTNDFQILHVSSLLADSSQRICLLIAEIDHDVFLGEQYGQDPASIEPMIRSQYGEGRYKYVAEENKYQIKGTAKLYALTPKDTLNFTFLNEQYSQSRVLGGLLDAQTIQQLKAFEARVR